MNFDVSDPKARLLREGTYGILCHLFSAGCNLLIILMAVRFLGADGYGVYVSAFVIVSGVALLGCFGFEQSLIPLVQELTHAGRQAAVPLLLRNALILSFLLTFLATVVALACREYLAGARDAGAAFPPTLLAVAPLGLAMAWRSVFSGYLAAVGRIREVFSVNMLLIRSATLVCVAGLLGLKYAGVLEGHPATFAACICAVEVGAVAWMFRRYRLLSAKEIGGQEVVAAGKTGGLRRLVRSSLPVAMHNATSFANTSLDKIMVGFLSPRIADVGVLHVAGTFANLARLPHGILTRSFGPMASSLNQQKKDCELKELYERSSFLSIVSGVSIVVLLALWAPLLFRLYGEAFRAAYVPMLVLLTAQVATVCTGPCGYMLMMIGRSRVMGLNMPLAVAINFFGNLLLIPRYGILGAAYANAVAYVVSNLIFAVALYRYTRIHAFSAEAISFLGAMAALGIFSFILRHWLSMPWVAVTGTGLLAAILVVHLRHLASSWQKGD